jgi:hypothetical protein
LLYLSRSLKSMCIQCYTAWEDCDVEAGFHGTLQIESCTVALDRGFSLEKGPSGSHTLGILIWKRQPLGRSCMTSMNVNVFFLCCSILPND